MTTVRADDIANWARQAAPGAHLAADSRQVKRGDVFLAYPGQAADGRRFIAQAVEAGAAAVVHEEADFAWDDSWKVPHLPVAGLKQQAGAVAAAFYGNPDSAMFVAAVTGTNGKTSCTQWIANALSRLGEPAAVIGTLGIGLYHRGRPGNFDETGNTTPDAVLLQRRLAELRDQHAGSLAIEASSIGLDQGRMNGLHVDVALFTNLSRDHLDYHGDMASYEAAKLRLFTWPGLKHAVINLDDDAGLRFVSSVQEQKPNFPIIGYTLTGRAVDGVANLRASEVRSSHGGTAFRLDSRFGTAQVKTQLVGQFNVSNVLGIIGVLLAKGVDFATAIEAAEELTAVPGRMQQLGGQEAPLVVIDYAHTPDALEKTLATLRQVAQQRSGELWCVFGCGGDRDPGKRPQMGAVSQAADHIIVTSDNPRSEDPAKILEQIVAGIDAKRMQERPPHVVEDRAAAILWAVRHAGKNDVVLLAGKGHEDYQEIKGRKLPFLDADHASLALAARATMKGMI
ncbi:UDP-N-acetylmuramoyl-L-alanyl-D-glutamate--2,6-diaminopimelate ligase [Oxalobacteraceae bacterium OM1]|nr:UDP-N-acetylmuramoyl-L-alanyl-D-glutamate--2,6-diaminopimelate ligase [Oxalobacteraceae bacterium OM1]